MTTETATLSDMPAYGRFTRRLQAVFIDSIVLMLLVAGTLIIAVALKSDNIARILGFTVAAVWLLYEPLLVSMTGGTVGHYLCNLRVVDDSTGGNVGFGKAIARVVIKTVLGLYSFIAMGLTSRHQAVHDLVTRSTVQIRDLAKAAPYHFRVKSEDLSAPGMPSRLRRLVVIVVYLLGCFSLFALALAAASQAGLISDRCIYDDACKQPEALLLNALGLVWLGASVGFLILGWRGRLWGGKAQRQRV